MKIFCKFPTVNRSKLNFWLIICIAKNFIWTTLKVIFSIFRYVRFFFWGGVHSQTPDFQIVLSHFPILTNHTSMERFKWFHTVKEWINASIRHTAQPVKLIRFSNIVSSWFRRTQDNNTATTNSQFNCPTDKERCCLHVSDSDEPAWVHHRVFIPFGWYIPHRDETVPACRHKVCPSKCQTPAVQRDRALQTRKKHRFSTGF